jgi:hypothetical protein
MNMENYGLSTVSATLGDGLVYRNLEPMDERLPRFAELAARAGTNVPGVPRKTDPDYARTMVELLNAARALDGSGPALRRLLYVGDTRMSDGIAFQNLCRATSWLGIAFIGAESRDPARVELVTEATSTLYLANRWGMLHDFEHYCRTQGFPIDAETAVVLDLDKTLLGARGRNDHVIDDARVQAVRQTVETLLGSAFDMVQFEASYNLLNRPEFHPFTVDNQDYLAYVCLILGSDLFTLEALVEEIRAGQLQTFDRFIGAVDARAAELPEQLQALHADICERVKAGDATPFKAFRYNEYRLTVSRMGHFGANAPASALLAREIVLTQELCAAAQRWRQQGALLFGLSDKPDEASLPSPALAQEGFRPLHQTRTHAVGGASLAATDETLAVGRSAF